MPSTFRLVPGPSSWISLSLVLITTLTFVVLTAAATAMNPLVFKAASRHTATVIFLHGLGDTGAGWASAVENWQRRSRLAQVKFILPNAPHIPITAVSSLSPPYLIIHFPLTPRGKKNGGFRMPGWFDLYALTGKIDDLRDRQDKDGMLSARAYVEGLIQAEIDAGIPASRIAVGGFSQGGAIALFSAITGKHKLAGAVGLSSWLVLDKEVPNMLTEDGRDLNRTTPIFMGHGSADPMVPTAFGQQSCDELKKLGFDASMKMYP